MAGSPREKRCPMHTCLLDLSADCLRLVLRQLRPRDVCTLATVCVRLAEVATEVQSQGSCTIFGITFMSKTQVLVGVIRADTELSLVFQFCPAAPTWRNSWSARVAPAGRGDVGVLVPAAAGRAGRRLAGAGAQLRCGSGTSGAARSAQLPCPVPGRLSGGPVDQLLEYSHAIMLHSACSSQAALQHGVLCSDSVDC